MKQKKILIVTSSGGHLVKSYLLADWWENFDRVWVTRKDELVDDLLKDEKLYFGHFPENRHIGNFFRNLWLARQVLKIECPDVVFSMGAGIAPPFLFIAKLMRIKTVFVETFITVPRPTLSGRLVYPFVDLFLVQNVGLLKDYPRAKYWGSIL